ncbi:uncharacterized protein [Epargyreus clarus]|uniref:uncharacterized protein n=1 Tax=Epargyreus clarus TaxID=520877 RepID=UPI003C2D6379
MNFNVNESNVLHWNYRGFTEFPLHKIQGDESDITDIYLKENLITRVPSDIGKLENLESLYLSGNDITELPREISKLKCLKCFDLSGNRLRRIPDEIGEVRNLKFLILDENDLCELPLRIADLRALRYLSVCDNKLQWLPQRPVYNYHHCEFRFWRNIALKTIPYSLWYHMFRGQQTRSLNIGCLSYPKYQHVSGKSRCRLQLRRGSREWDIDIHFPPQHSIIEHDRPSPPSLFELSKRRLYEIICVAAKRLSTTPQSIYADSWCNKINEFENNNNVNSIQEYFEGFHLNAPCDLNGNSLVFPKTKRRYYSPADLVEEFYDFLPSFIKTDLSNGPVSSCENINCRRPLFDHVIYEFCLEKIILIGNTEEVILSAAFCSKTCADFWKFGKSSVLTWTLVK